MLGRDEEFRPGASYCSIDDSVRSDLEEEFSISDGKSGNCCGVDGTTGIVIAGKVRTLREAVRTSK